MRKPAILQAKRKPKVLSIDSGNHRTRVRSKRDALVKLNLHLVPPIAIQIFASLPPSFDLDDLIQTGRIGLISAATRYAPQLHRGTPFSAYARDVIRGTIKMSVRRRNYVDNTHVSLDRGGLPSCYGGDDGIPDCYGDERYDLDPGVDNDIEVTIDRKRLIERIDVEREKLSHIQASVLTAYYSIGKPSLAAVAIQLGIPEWRAGRAHTEALVILRRILNTTAA